MRSEKRSKLHIGMRLAGILLLAAVFSIYMMSGIYAKYMTTDRSADEARVAGYVFDLSIQDKDNNTLALDISDLSKADEEKVFYFLVTNDKSGKVSEVAQRYEIEIEHLGSLPIVTKLEKESGPSDAVMQNNGVQATFSANQQETHRYKLTVKLDSSALLQGADADITDDASVLTVTVNAAQID